MSEPYVGEIRMFAASFAPAGWEFCDGRLLPISENDTLFNLIGTTYGGDGQQTFGLPNLQGRVAVHPGMGPGLSQNYFIGQAGGVELVTLSTQQIPAHTHSLLGSTGNGAQASPQNAVLASSTIAKPYNLELADSSMAPNAIGPVGGSQPHSNMQPYLVINFIISLFGIYPSQT